MYWADKIANEIIDSKQHLPYWVDDMKTPSGRVHIGSVRAVVTHDLIRRALFDLGKKVTFTYVLEDHDPMDGLPIYVDQEKYRQEMGKPLFMIPSPEPGYKSYGRRWGEEYIEIFNKIGVHPKIIWGSELYMSGKMNNAVQLCLDKASEIRKIYKKFYKKERPKDWYPFSPRCGKCNKISTTTVTAWDGEKVTYECKIDGLEWTKGCGNKGKASPFSSNNYFAGKLPWKVEWPCKWNVIGVTIEGAGKDHMSAGSSHDFAKLMCKNVLNYPVPYAFSHEFFLVGGRKMSSSKGFGSSALEVSEIIPPYLVRFMISRVKFSKQIDFDPFGMTIPNLFDEYDKCAGEYWDNKGTVNARIFEVSQVSSKQPKMHFLPRFRDIANYSQLPNIKLEKRFEEIKGSKLTDIEIKDLYDRLTYVFIWLSKYAPDEYKYQISIKSVDDLNLSEIQWRFLNDLGNIWQKVSEPENLQSEIFRLIKKIDINTKDAFKALYTVVLDKDHGPRAGWLLKKFPKKDIIGRLTSNQK
ncbi:MAG: hypothetical protein ACD_57C00036G0003 [uncultured bacterium]|uniref:Lysine--tRNA ligase n=1 Tax=Candidatus Woesebacteria bacterium RIFCSPHIGHO2_12_FULL_41_24 TaxID=1802510 RepID=A0A1F8AVG5_9BACT|nr:MAG: hypothetical protein ACD_57C00036G0003 [uncultured bacterium]OGM14151.1 MAG: lysine--tRNA ligase [Candidatus Woesebacteria bacterium RBG_16_41_13]OGM28564.1 MAG: lysine--tRNA ligase [Candidatus Woesebacteria bacterium RIFCSPHIGHO2_01_FULL_42_80]OGM35614.1 MAG: lysine--tRNA ligase [Candidatus Woesebacteria bacterium RIFCSPHIGHO2_02_FULL_42_20]OGM55225.1 MAG: lysine--tRNA ligase [Candidatus Woesebacteria bacterium RIFCSPHIGHO2_12_FULL_41_24]OGM67179.1 MAG: lysine--tRNA ligase [Candidatus